MSNNRFRSSVTDARTQYHKRKQNDLVINTTRLLYPVVFELPANMHTLVRNHADPPRNPNYEKDIAYVTKYLKWILNSIGIWPATLKGIGKFLPKITIGLSNLMVLFIEVQCVLHILLEEKDPFLRMRLLGLSCYTLISLLKYSALAIRKSKIKYCIEQMYADWKQVSRSMLHSRG